MEQQMGFSESDIWLFKEGSHFNLYEKMGAHLLKEGGCQFSVWAPHASYVSVVGDFNFWKNGANPMNLRWDGSGIWEITVPQAIKGQKYKYHIVSGNGHHAIDKSDPFGFFCEQPPGNASIIWDLDYHWHEESWIKDRHRLNDLHSPFLIYEIHLPSWKRIMEDNDRSLTYRELAHVLPKYIKEMGFTHVEFLPIMEHPLYGSWGYQTLGYFAPSSRYGSPQDFMHLVESLHNENIGVILDWVPSHFPSDGHGLSYFDGTYLYEFEDTRKRTHPDWNTYVFDYSKSQVRNFLISNALFWCEKYHIDGLRMDAVASMLYLDFSRRPNEWVPNIYGGRENLEAIEFLRRLNTVVYEKHPYVQLIAEESTDWPMVSKPTYVGGLGFGMKWNMGWMHDILYYFSQDPINRKYHHNILLFTIYYAFSENFILPLSHDEVVHEKRSLIGKMPGDTWQKFANLRLLFGFMYAHPGKKLLFMGDEFGQWSEWNHDKSLDWNLLDYPLHKQLQLWVKDLNFMCRNNPALFELDFSHEGFEWMDNHDWEGSIISFVRNSKSQRGDLFVICNFTPVVRDHYRVGVPKAGYWKEVLNSDSEYYGGSGQGNKGGLHSENIECFGRPQSICITLPPLSVLYFKLV